ncbi:unnamed protein product [Enterobius vermicularis]|uniref:Uncharacterized protein n=1 Tax=Enterobius vermicularis TaxID=51028 RepID=A0A0N4VAQ7_ENTVE|nr:unnamed protein product [Enterobius vermicularis]
MLKKSLLGFKSVLLTPLLLQNSYDSNISIPEKLNALDADYIKSVIPNLDIPHERLTAKVLSYPIDRQNQLAGNKNFEDKKTFKKTAYVNMPPKVNRYWPFKRIELSKLREKKRFLRKAIKLKIQRP